VPELRAGVPVRRTSLQALTRRKHVGFDVATGVPIQLNMRRALLLDDEKIERSILQTILIDAGFDVHALPISARLPFSSDHRLFDIAILDLSASMQNESQIVSLCEALAGTAVLIMTDNGTISQALRVGAATAAIDYIKKPFSKEEFLAAIDRAIQHARVLRENWSLKQHQQSIQRPRTES